MRKLLDPSRKRRRDMRPSELEKAVMDIRRAFRMQKGAKALLLGARMLIRAAQHGR